MFHYSYIITGVISSLCFVYAMKVAKIKTEFEKYGVTTKGRVFEYRELRGRKVPFIKFRDGDYEILANLVADNMDEKTAPVGTTFDVVYLKREVDGKLGYAVRAKDPRFAPRSIQNVLNVFIMMFAVGLILTVLMYLYRKNV